MTEQLNNSDKPCVGVSCLQLDKEGEFGGMTVKGNLGHIKELKSC